MYAADTGSTVNCDPGSGIVNGHCEVCQAGYYSPGGQEPCSPCPVDMYSPSTGADACVQCNSGLCTNNLTGQASCDDTCYVSNSGLNRICPRGYCCDGTNAYACNKGTYSDAEGVRCKAQTTAACQQAFLNGRGGSGEGGGGDEPHGGGTHACIDYNFVKKGACPNDCSPGCTTANVGSVSGAECTVPTAAKFCIGGNCFKWPADGSIYEEPVSDSIRRQNSCPGS